MNTCFFIGHREADERILPALIGTVHRLVREENVRCFYVGGYGGFDRLAGVAVKEAKKLHADVTLNLVLPYHPAEKKTELLPGYDGSYYPEGLEKVPRRYAIIRANKIMVDSSDWLVCYVKHGASNSRKVLEYAQNRAGKGLIHIENLAEAF